MEQASKIRGFCVYLLTDIPGKSGYLNQFG